MNVQTPNDLRVYSAGLDWVSATTKFGDRGETTARAYRRWTEARGEEGHEVKEWHWNGYNGERCEGISWGTRDDGHLIRLSGEMAKRHGLSALTWADNVSRLDVQVTTQNVDNAVNWATVACYAAQSNPSIKSGHTSARIISQSPGGDTFYIGKRISDRLMRVYDKYSESGGEWPPGCWRWEVEYKNARAVGVAVAIRMENGSNEFIRHVVEQAFAAYNVVMPTKPLDRDWRDSGVRHATSDERRIEWLRNSVAPMLSRLLNSPHRRQTIEALGLQLTGDGKYVDIATGEVVWG